MHRGVRQLGIADVEPCRPITRIARCIEKRPAHSRRVLDHSTAAIPKASQLFLTHFHMRNGLACGPR